MYPAGARTRGGPAPPALWLPMIGSQSVRGAEPGTLLAPIHSHSTSREGRGLLREGHDCRLFQGRSGAIFSFFFFFHFLAFVSLTNLRVQHYKPSGHKSTPPTHKSASHLRWWKAFRSCRPWSRIFPSPAHGSSLPFKDVFPSRGLADAQTTSTQFSFALLG